MAKLRGAWSVRVFTSVLLMASVASATPASERLRARSLFNQGEELFSTNDFAGAERAFEEAYRTLPKAIVLLRIAECQEKRDNLQGAVETLEAYLKAAPDAPDRAAVEEQLATIRQKPGIVTVTSTPSGAAIWVDGIDSSHVTPFDVSILPGEHVVTTKMADREDATQSVGVAFGARQTLDFNLLAVENAPPATSPSPAPERTPSSEAMSEGWHPTTPFWIAAGVAVAGAATGTIFGIQALGKQSDFDQHPANATADAGERDARIADVAFGVSVAAGVTAAIFYFTSDRRQKTTDVGWWSVAPAVDAGKFGVRGMARF